MGATRGVWVGVAALAMMALGAFFEALSGDSAGAPILAESPYPVLLPLVARGFATPESIRLEILEPRAGGLVTETLRIVARVVESHYEMQ